MLSRYRFFMNGFKVSCILIGLVMLSGCDQRNKSSLDLPSLRLSTKVTPAQPRPGETFVFRIDLDYQKSAFKNPLEPPQVGSKIQGLSIVEDRINSAEEVDSRIYISREYALRAEIASAYILPEVQISTEDGQLIKTGKIYLEISSDGTGLGAQDIADIDPLTEHKFSRDFSGYWWLLLFLLIIAISIALYRRASKDELMEIALEPWEWVESEIKRVEIQELLNQEKYREFYDAWSQICRGYLNRRFGIQAEESTLQELLPLISSLDLAKELQSDFQILFPEADLARFAEVYKGQVRLQRALDFLIKLVEQTTVKDNPADQYEEYVEGDEVA